MAASARTCIMNTCEGASVNRHLILDGTNYTYWKSRMCAYIRSLDKAWTAVTKGWSRPVQKDKNGNESLKDELYWSADEERAALGNFRALSAIFTFVDDDQMRHIYKCESAKEAWDILQNIHEGSDYMMNTRGMRLYYELEDLRMGKDESISEFFRKLNDIANKANQIGKRYQIGEKYSENDLVQKALRSLPKEFHPKITAIEASRDTSTLRLDELMSSLQVFEMHLNTWSGGNKKDDGDFDVVKDLALLIKHISQKLKKIEGKLKNYK